MGTLKQKTAMEKPRNPAPIRPDDPGADAAAAREKRALRAALLARRRALAPAEAAARSARVLERVRALPAWASARQVLAYMPVRGEVDVAPLVEELWARGVRVLLPRCRPGQPGVMDVACAPDLAVLRPGAHGIAEPDPDACPAEAAPAPDLVLVPGVGFDRRGLRLGFGGGFYDRFLAGLGRPGPLLLAPCYAFQLLEALPADPWDIPVDVIITEEETLWPRPPQRG